MIYLNKYNSFLEEVEVKYGKYDIYNFYDDIRSSLWTTSHSLDVKKYSDVFIGDGIYNKISSKVDDMLSKLKKIDIEYINDRLMDVYDNSSPGIVKNSILYGSYLNYNKDTNGKYNGILYFTNKDDIILHILREILYPTLFIKTEGINKTLRRTDDEIYVTDKMHQCVNFDITNMDALKSRVELSKMSKIDIAEKKLYSVDKVIDMYQPAICIKIGDNKREFNLSKLENDLDEILPIILDGVDYKEVIFDINRYDTIYERTYDISEYTLKILL